MRKQSRSVAVESEFAADSHDAQQLREPKAIKRTRSMPSASINVNASSPKSETGLSMAIEDTEGSSHDDRQDAPRAVGETQSATIVGNKPLVLLIEDTIEIAEVIQAALSRTHVQTTHESHGGRALLRYADIKPDLILLDIGLPDISGWQFLEGIKERHKSANTVLPPVIVITAFGDPANRLVGKFQGVFDYLIKPFTAAEVERVVTKALSARDE